MTDKQTSLDECLRTDRKNKICIVKDVFINSAQSAVASMFTHRNVSCEMFINLKPSEDLVEKIKSPVIFDTNRSFKQ